MNFNKRMYSMWTYILPTVFLCVSWPVFWKIYSTTKLVIDEEFHLRQGLSFCNMRFREWDSKITTFPGLYLIAVVLNPINMCNVLGLRLISLIAATINVVLFYKIRLRMADTKQSVIDAISLACLPPLYFFSHVYYTDVMSLTCVLLFYYNWLRDARLYSSVFGAASLLMRQTNIIWIAMTVGITAVNRLLSNYERKVRLRHKAKLFKFQVLWEILTSFDVILMSAWQTIIRCSLSMLIILPFLAFVVLNGSIVVGDKQAHEATFHLPQLFYFSVFTMVFAISNTLQHGKAVIFFFWRNKCISIFILGVLIIVVKWNTLVHPYLLADNRHYTFYFWNRFYGRYTWFKYAMTPVYLFALAIMLRSIKNCHDYFQLVFWLAVIFVLCFQKLLEVRYFLTPFVLLRLHMDTKRAVSSQLIELGMYVFLNAVTLYLFFTKEIVWPEYKFSQRIIW